MRWSTRSRLSWTTSPADPRNARENQDTESRSMPRYIEIAVVVVSLAASAHAVDAQELINAVVASVDGAPITMLDLEKFTATSGRLLSPEERGSPEAVLDT